jgi:glycosyltransferase involved in cell wall biosynthesis
MSELVLSVVLATRNRKQQLARCLDSLAGQTHPRERWEVIVVHDGDASESDDPEQCFRDRFSLRSLSRPHAGCGIARNTGAAEARGMFLIFTDDDCLFPPDWLSRYEHCFRANPDCVIAGAAINSLPSNPYSQATQAMGDLLMQYSNPSADRAGVAFGNNMGVPTADFLRVGGFSLRFFRTFSEDRDFCGRWLADRRRIVFDRSLVVFHAHELNLLTFLQQHYSYGQGSFFYHRAQVERHQRAWQPIGFYTSLLLGRAPSMRVRCLLMLSQVAHTFGFASAMLGFGRYAEAEGLPSHR